MGSPAAGIRENVSNVTREHIESYIAQNLVGSNITVAAAGGVSQDTLSAAVEKAFGGLPQNSPSAERNGSEKPH